MKSIVKFLILILLSSLYSCKAVITEKSSYKAGIVLSFDDNYVNSWVFADSILNKYNWKASFCISKPFELNSIEKNKLIYLYKIGHKFANHSYNHIDLKKNKKYSFEKYELQEILPLKFFLDSLGIKSQSFVYPYGNKNSIFDSKLKNKFKIVRCTSQKIFKKIKLNNFFLSNSNIVYGLGIDKSYKHYDEKFFINALKYAKKNGKIIIFYAHKPVKKSTKTFEVEISTLENICKFVVDNQMRFYTLDDLNKFIK